MLLQRGPSSFIMAPLLISLSSSIYTAALFADLPKRMAPLRMKFRKLALDLTFSNSDARISRWHLNMRRMIWAWISWHWTVLRCLFTRIQQRWVTWFRYGQRKIFCTGWRLCIAFCSEMMGPSLLIRPFYFVYLPSARLPMRCSIGPRLCTFERNLRASCWTTSWICRQFRYHC